MIGTDEVAERWARHPLRRLVRMVRELLAEIAEEAQHVVALTDENGRLLWIEGTPHLRSNLAEETSFVEGRCEARMRRERMP